MNAAGTLRRKWIYLAILVGLLFPLSQLARPAGRVEVVDPIGERRADAPPGPVRAGSSGGWLDQIRHREGLANDQLMDIDPTSETMKLAALGLRPLAVTILWQQSQEYKKKEDWSNLLAVSKLILRLQPSFIEVWKHVSWNIAYNVSVEWDDYRDRYHWVMEGIRLNQRGVEVNQQDPSLLWWLGWMVSHKISKSDEAELFRKLFVKDDDFHGTRKLRDRDSWLVGKGYYRQAEEVVDSGRSLRPFRGTAIIIFHSSGPLNNFYYALGLAKDGIYDEVCREAWVRAFQEWAGSDPNYKPLPFGERKIKLALTPYETQTRDDTIQLNHYERMQAEAARLKEEFEKLVPGLRDKLVKEREATLTEEERLALAAKPELRSEAAHMAVYRAEQKLLIRPQELAAAVPAELRTEADRLLQEIGFAEAEAHWIFNYRGIVNFEYWRVRADSEQTEDAGKVRRLHAEAKKAGLDQDADFRLAIEKYSLALEYSRLLTEAYPSLLKESLSAEELFSLLKEYKAVLQQVQEEFVRGYGLVSVAEIRDWSKFLAELKAAPAEPTTAAGALRGVLSESLRTSIDRHVDGTAIPLGLKLEVLDGLNALLQRPDLQSLPFAKDAKISDDARATLGLPADERTGHALRLANRAILDATWADEIVPAKNEFVLAELIRTHATMADFHELRPPGFEREIPQAPATSGAGTDQPASTAAGSSASTSSGTAAGTASADTKPADTKPADTKPADSKPAGTATPAPAPAATDEKK